MRRINVIFTLLAGEEETTLHELQEAFKEHVDYACKFDDISGFIFVDADTNEDIEESNDLN